ncbi:hypothetical protein QKT49_gp200 [Acanthamoeba castellanii medusavirus]|uniref:Uncharacterized protein n=1 Tax=Acanthamoeba castellanii medusavirus J1 TaxID=3114988 RepID=A0A3T1CXK7_9VIRU|nr:hypothetical protein QKT49_gp200 [Acanthamoeba castellanii medusavirus]BBI30563.1 hypothetical protein [Acanthamoeba castellanii medusavirus J1]
MAALANTIFTALIAQPLYTLYRRGPSIAGYGWWEGASDEDICSRLTGVNAEFWRAGPASSAMCSELIDRKFDAFVIGTLGVVAIGTLGLLVAASFCRCVLVDPLVGAFSHPRKQQQQRRDNDDDE